MSDALMDLHNHYKAVRARLNGSPPPKPQALLEPDLNAMPAPPAIPPLTALATPAEDLIRGLRGFPAIREKVLPVLSRHNIRWVEAVGKSHKWKYTKCRFEIYVTLRAHGLFLSQIGRLCGDRDHTTVLHGIRKFLAENLSDMQRMVCKDLGVCPSKYYVHWMELKEGRDDHSRGNS